MAKNQTPVKHVNSKWLDVKWPGCTLWLMSGPAAAMVWSTSLLRGFGFEKNNTMCPTIQKAVVVCRG